MFDIVEGAKVICGMAPSTAITAGSDWINTENMHRVWAICTASLTAGVSNDIEAQVAEDYTGASNSTATAKYWVNENVGAFDRMTASTNTTGVELGTSIGMAVVCFDPASADTSDHYFRVAFPTSGWYCGVVYICEPRYGGVAQFVATTSST